MTVSFDFSGKVAFVTGSGSGMGQATAVAFARAGAQVAIVDINPKGLDATAKLIAEAGGQALSLVTDVSDAAQVEAAVSQTVKQFGHLDVAFNNAAVFDHAGPVDTLDLETWNRVIGVNLSGIFYGIKYQVPVMLEQGSGSIINTGSVGSAIGSLGLTAYTASKHGVWGLTKKAALDYATKGIRVNAILPGGIDTPMAEEFSGGTDEGRAALVSLNPIGRLGRPDEIANAALWLASDSSSFVTGHALAVDGGWLAG
jgi:NAD(P)-dependent dehydrogenase (short-subunit alcohol dehydrogenase family)